MLILTSWDLLTPYIVTKFIQHCGDNQKGMCCINIKKFIKIALCIYRVENFSKNFKENLTGALMQGYY